VPKIAAANIEEHIRIQEMRILDAARDLFTTHGYRDTDMADISRSMGLARNSLYRYYSSKDHILVAVVKRDMVPFFTQLDEIEQRVADPVERIDAWIGLQMEIAAGPCDAMTRMLGEIPPNASELRKEITALHEPPSRVLLNAVRQLLEGSGRDAQLITAMISSMVQSAAGIAIQTKSGDACVEELQRSVSRILTSGQ
jgi:AcrR family transcriptional regulator